MDQGHCIMNMDDEDEYVDFYDFSKTYENHPLIIRGEEKNAIMSEIPEEEETKKKSKKEKTEDDGSDSDWDDCDLESIDSAEAAKAAEE